MLPDFVPAGTPEMIELGRRTIEAARSIEKVHHRQGDLIRTVGIVPEFDCMDGTCAFDDPNCVPGTGGSHGRGSRILFISVGVAGRGGVSAQIFTPISATDEDTEQYLTTLWRPLGGIDLHSPDEGSNLDCDVIDGKCSVAWGTMMEAELVLDIFLDRGVDGVWSYLGEAWLPRVLEREEGRP